ncbi:hypothetical protein [Vibrio cyclitrophicus]|uniref:hypothetical protein n=1 Tax=Vibrio cyclitrophicus TaxID=47951 RepID=UPI000C832AA0|nr:hypothetical protein [Vibrio cyclitrophicus]PME25528.1 hypothetical protein BCV41_16870 [Vibrio cyclitrophicus]
MTYSYRDLKAVMQEHKPLPEVAQVLASMLSNGFKVNTVVVYMYDFIDSADLDEDYENVLDDLIAAMEGDCHKNYILHPSHFKVENRIGLYA